MAAGPTTARYATARWRALGTYVELQVRDPDRLAAARALATALLDDVDRACSRFRDDSDLTRANRGAGGAVQVDPLLVAAVRAALAAAADTDGLVDPTLGRTLVALGYDTDLAAVTARTDDPAGIPVPPVPDAWRAVRTGPGEVQVPAGTALDLGATGKAFAADLVAARVAATGTACIVSLGGDVAVGVPPDDAGADGAGRVDWPVAVAERPGDPVQQTVLVDHGGLATSSVVHRRWRDGADGVHHLLDPRTGRPARGPWRTVSVVAPDAVAANTASTAAIVLGAAAPGWLADRDLAARLVGHDGRVVRVAGWPADGDLGAAADGPARAAVAG